MKTVLSVLCWIGIAVMISGCDNGDDDGGTAGGRGDWPVVSFRVDDNDNVTCFNADSNVVTTNQTCTWNCGLYAVNNPGNAPRKVVLVFDDALVCRDSGIEIIEDPDTGEQVETITQECSNELALVRENFSPCQI